MDLSESIIGDKELVNKQNIITDWSFVVPNENYKKQIKAGLQKGPGDV